jgi:hypothetical protein
MCHSNYLLVEITSRSRTALKFTQSTYRYHRFVVGTASTQAMLTPLMAYCIFLHLASCVGSLRVYKPMLTSNKNLKNICFTRK